MKRKIVNWKINLKKLPNAEQKDKEMKNTKDSLSNMEDGTKRLNIHLIGILKGKLKEKHI